MKITYETYRANRQKEYNDLPIFYAFTNESLKNKMEERGLTLDDTDKIYKLGGSGGFCLKTDIQQIRDFINAKDPLMELMEDEDFAVGAFKYEMDNHEYAINYYQGDWDVCNCFSDKKLVYNVEKDYKDYLKEAGYGDSMVKCYQKARKMHLHDAYENEWF